MKKYQKLLDTHFNNGEFVGAALGVFKEGRDEIISVGYSNLEENKKMNIESAFEIGSVSKVFTSLLIQVLEDRGLLCLEYSVGHYIGSLNECEVGNILIKDLCTHTSGLSRLPIHFEIVGWGNPYATYERRMFLASLTFEKLGEKAFEYSNQGYALLGLVVDEVYEAGFNQALYDLVINPLGLTQTFFERERYREGVLARGYQPGAIAQVYWDFGCFSSAGALKSTVRDLLTFSKAYIFPESTALSSSIKKHINLLLTDDRYIYHGGATYGFKSEFIIDLKRETNMVLLANTYDWFEGYISLFKEEIYEAKIFGHPPSVLLNKVIGVFEATESGVPTFNFFAYKGHLYLNLDGQLPRMQVWIGDTTFVEERLGVTLIYNESNDSFIFKQGSENFQLFRTK